MCVLCTVITDLQAVSWDLCNMLAPPFFVGKVLDIYNGINAKWDLHISALEGSRTSIFVLRSKSHSPLSESRVLRRLEELIYSHRKKNNRGTSVFWVEIFSFCGLLEPLDSDRGPWDLNLSAKIEDLDPSRAEISKFKILTRKKNDSVTPFVFFFIFGRKIKFLQSSQNSGFW